MKVLYEEHFSLARLNFISPINNENASFFKKPSYIEEELPRRWYTVFSIK